MDKQITELFFVKQKNEKNVTASSVLFLVALGLAIQRQTDRRSI